MLTIKKNSIDLFDNMFLNHTKNQNNDTSKTAHHSDKDLIYETSTNLQSIKLMIETYLNLQSNVVKSIETNNDGEIECHREKLSIVDTSLERLDIGMQQAHILLLAMKLVDLMDVDQMECRHQLKGLYEENELLGDELTTYTSRLDTVNMELMAIDMSKDQLQDLFLMRQKHAEDDMENFFKSNEDIFDDDADNYMPNNLKSTYLMAIKYAKEGRFEIAIAIVNQCLEDELKVNNVSATVASLYALLGVIYKMQDNNKQSLEVMMKALKVREKVFGNEHPAVAEICNNVAVLHLKMHNTKDAETYSRRALKIRKTSFGVDDPIVGKSCNNLALVLYKTSKNEEPERLFIEAIRIYRLDVEKFDTLIIKTQNNLVAYYVQNKKTHEAELVLKEIIANRHNKKFEKCTVKRDPFYTIFEKEKLKSKEKVTAMAQQLHKDYGSIKDNVIIVTTKNLSCLYKMTKRVEYGTVLDEYVKLSMEQTPNKPTTGQKKNKKGKKMVKKARKVQKETAPGDPEPEEEEWESYEEEVIEPGLINNIFGGMRKLFG